MRRNGCLLLVVLSLALVGPAEALAGDADDALPFSKGDWLASVASTWLEQKNEKDVDVQGGLAAFGLDYFLEQNLSIGPTASVVFGDLPNKYWSVGAVAKLWQNDVLGNENLVTFVGMGSEAVFYDTDDEFGIWWGPTAGTLVDMGENVFFGLDLAYRIHEQGPGDDEEVLMLAGFAVLF